MSVCVACAARVADSYRFCPQCGASTQGEAPRRVPFSSARRARGSTSPGLLPERKQVSVLFVDLCDSTAHVLHADPEEARAYLDAALQLMTQAVKAYGGTVSQLLGDGLLALFGAPVAQEDHALRACLAALAMQTDARQRSDVAGAPGFVLRVGIHSGEVIVGVTGSQLWSHYRADGTTIHLASRLEKLARPGSVLLSAATQRLVAEQLDTLPLGAHPIRGVDTAMELFELVVGTEHSAAAPLTRREHWAPLVGRDDALGVLDAIAQTVRSGSMRVLGLRGEAGIGKSRLIAEWCASAGLEGFDICTTNARGYASASSYSVIADVVRELIGLARAGGPALQQAAALSLLGAWPADGARHRAAVCDLLELPGTDDAWRALTPTQRRRRIADALHWLITQRLRTGPLLLVLEDIFLADRESQRLLESLMPRLAGMPVLVCASFRQDFEHRWAEEPWFLEHWLAPLHAVDMKDLALAMLGSDASTPGVIDEIVERADGNPFFLEQLVITLIDDGSLIGTPGAYHLARPQAEFITPASIAAVIGARVDRLSPAAKAALEAAAILGDPITAELIAAMQETTQAEADRQLRLGVAAGLMTTAPAAVAPGDAPRGFLFRHSLVQEVLVGTLTRPRRKALHRCAFVALKAHQGCDDTEAAPTLTRHAFRGEEWAQAAGYAVKSMARAVSRSANREALRMFELGLDASRRVADAPVAQALELALLLEAIGALMPLGQIDAIVTNLERAEAIAEQLGDQRCRATVSLQTAVFLWMRGRYTQGLGCATQAMEAGRMAARRNLQMAAGQARMMMFHGLGRYRESADEARSVFRDFDPELRDLRWRAGWATAPIINLHSFYASALWRLGDYASGQRACDRAYELLADVDHPYSRGLVDFVQGQLWIEQGRHAEAQALMRASVESCALHDVPTLMPCSVAMLGSALARSGNAEEAATVLGSALRERIYLAGGTYGEMFLRLNQGVALRFLGRWAEAIDAGEQAAELARLGEQHGHLAKALYELSETLQAAGQAAGARDAMARALGQAHRSEMPFYIERASSSLASLDVRQPA